MTRVPAHVATRTPAHVALGLQFERTSVATRVALALALAALWLMGRRYSGITHDATLYALTALRRLDPAAFAADPFFAHASQDAYTLFPLLYAPLIEALGVGAAALALTVAGQVAFLAAAALLAWRIAEGPERWWSLALLAVLSGFYGGVGVFRIGESFATARTLAEPLVLAAFVAVLAARPPLAWALLGVAFLIHPLVAAAGAAVVLLVPLARRLRLIWIPAALMAAAVLAALFALASTPFDEPWRKAVQDRTPYLFVSLWLPPDWSRVLWGIGVLWLARKFVRAEVRALALAALVAGLAGILATAIAVDVLDGAFAAGFQFWRSHWPMHLLAILLAPVVVRGLWRSSNSGRAAAACIIASCCFGRSELPVAAVLAGLAVALEAAERRWPGWVGLRASRAGQLLAACAASVGLLLEVQSRMPLTYGATAPATWSDYAYTAASVGVLLPAAALLWVFACSRWRVAGVVLASVACGAALHAWDARSPWARFIEQQDDSVRALAGSIERGAQVFWPSPLSSAWLVLRRASWYGADQGAGIVFSRETAIDHAARKRAAQDLIAATDNCRFAGPGCRIGAARAVTLCARADAPRYLVLEAPLDIAPLRTAHLPPGLRPGLGQLHLYDCAELARK